MKLFSSFASSLMMSVFISVIFGSVVLIFMPVRAKAQTDSSRVEVYSFAANYVFHGVKWVPIEVGDEAGHVMGTSECKGLVITAEGEVATCHEVTTFEHTNGNGITEGYFIFIFSDSSEQVLKIEGRDEKDENDKISWNGKYEYVSGSGRFKGIKGNGTFYGGIFPDVNSGYNIISGSYRIDD